MQMASRKVIAGLMVLALCITTLSSAGSDVEAKAKASLKTKKISVKVGKKKSILIKNKTKKHSYSFTSSNKQVAKDSINEFLDSFSKVIDNSLSVLEKNRYCAVVIGDKYANSQVIPLGFYCMNLMMEKGLLLKAILVKNFGETKGKSNKQGIWRYRALASDFYIFKHEYIFVFKKVK